MKTVVYIVFCNDSVEGVVIGDHELAERVMERRKAFREREQRWLSDRNNWRIKAHYAEISDASAIA